MTVEEQLLLNTMTSECTRLHKAIENIKAEIEQKKDEAERYYGHPLGFDKIETYRKCLDIIKNTRREKQNEVSSNIHSQKWDSTIKCNTCVW